MPKNIQRTEKLFRRFNNSYGHVWSNRFTTKKMLEEAVEEWTVDMDVYTNNEMEAAYKACKHRHVLAPTLPQFVALLKTERARKYEPEKAEVELRDKEIARRGIQQMRSILKHMESKSDDDQV